MGRFFGEIGFEDTQELDPINEPGVYTENIIARNYYGDVERDSLAIQQSKFSINDDIKITNRISIVADPFAQENFHSIRYATYMGTKWKVVNAENAYPRIVLTLGGVYNAH